ncbi:MAG: mechanosensitive ion channel [Tissierellales bacterium]|nr:mechanosensitive ion channel [Tissierellales bacterium]
MSGVFAGVGIVGLIVILVQALVVFVVGKLIIQLVMNTFRKMLEKSKLDPMLRGFAVSVVNFVLMFILIIAILRIFGIDTSSFVAMFGAATLAIGFALQGNLSNFASGVMLVSFKPFKVGDYVVTSGHEGAVVEIGMFMSTLKTPDNKQILIPNSSITGGSIVNYSAYSERRVDLKIGVGYDSDINQVKKVIQDVIDNNEKILLDKGTFVRMGEMADSSINFTVRVWAKTEHYWDVYFDLNEEIKEKLDSANIDIPYPHVTVDMKK